MTKNTNDSLDIYISTIVRLKSIFVLLLLLILIIECCNGRQSLNADDCPVYCSCYIRYQVKWASCAGKRLVNVHTGVSRMVQALDLSNNSISKLDDFEFAGMKMLRLKYLNLSNNAISEINLFAFAFLHELTILDLSMNHFDYLIPSIFIDNDKLQIVRLSGNNFHYKVPHLESSTITDLSLSGCQISHLPPGIFDDLKRLRNLDISNNIMIQLDLGIIKVLPYLQMIKIDRNPWSCDNSMDSLKFFLDSKSISYNSSICDKKKSHLHNPIMKFERITLPKIKNPKANNPNSESVPLPADDEDENEYWESPSTESKELPINNNNNCKFANESSIATYLPPFWFFIIGFSLGCGVGMVSIRIWLMKQRANSLSRLSLLDTTPTHSDPTLPTYCEVMSDPNRHPHI